MGLLGPAARCVRVNCRSSVKTACKRLHDSKLVQGFVTHSLSIVGHAEKNMAVDSVRIHRQRVSEFNDCFVVPPRVIQRSADVRGHNDGQWIKLSRSSYLPDCLVIPSNIRQKPRIAMVRRSVIWLELDCAPIFDFRAFPIPIIVMLHERQ